MKNPAKAKILFVLLFSMTMLLNGQVPSAGLVGAWPFNGNSNDISGFNNHGSVVGATLTSDRCGNPSSAYSFNGTSDYILMQTAGPTGTVSRSFSFWAKTTQSSLMCLLSYGGITGGTAFAIQYNYNCPGVGPDVNNQAFTRGNSCINNGKWHHVVAILNSSVSTQIGSMQFYVDGTLLPAITCTISGTTQTVNTGNTKPVTIGRIHDVLQRFFSGAMDDIYIYDRVLTYNEVIQLYNASPCSATIAGPTNVCLGNSYIYSITPTTAGMIYNWTLPSGWSGSSTTSTILVTPGNSGGSISAMSGSGNCTASFTDAATTTVSVGGAGGITISAPPVVCANQTFTLVASGGASNYTWLPGNSNGSVLTTVAGSATTYSVMAVNQGCMYSSSVNVQVYPPYFVAINGPTLVCVNQSFTLQAIGVPNYTWMPGNFTGSSITGIAANNTPTTYIVVGLDNNGCSTTSTFAISGMVCDGVETMSADKIYLHPSTIDDELYVENAEGFSYSLYELSGRVVDSGMIELKSSKIAVSSLISGVYLLILEKDLQFTKLKILKK
jgi:hypothetical protein